MRPAKLGVVLLTIFLVAGAAAAQAADRVALVVGNGTYAHIGRLPNPGNDASDMTAALGRLGFDVTTVRDADRTALAEALRVFTRASAGADVSLVFYAGHGLEMGRGELPRSSRRASGAGTPTSGFEAVVLDDVLASTVGADLRVVILDACRKQPAGAFDAADGGVTEREPGELREPGRIAAGGRDAGGVCGGGGDDGGRRDGPEQPVHVGAAVVPGAAAGDSGCCSGRSGRGCWRRRKGGSDRTSMRRCWGSTTCERRWVRTRERWRRRWGWTGLGGG